MAQARSDTTAYEIELSQLEATYASAMAIDLDAIKQAVSGASESSVIGVGSGGSYTVASLLCNLHEFYTGRVSRPSTPLELICNPTLASSSPIFLISAEGKNPDVLEVLERVRTQSARPIGVLTNRGASPLIDLASRYTEIATFVFELEKKDGYLATNSLVLDATIIARAYGELNRQGSELPSSVAQLEVGDQSIAAWVAGVQEFAAGCAARDALIIVYSPLLKPIAADLESKLSESALLHVQLADLRSFSHGRHLWLADRVDDCAVLALTEPSLGGLWDRMNDLFPVNALCHQMNLCGATPRDLISGLMASMHFVSSIAQHRGLDPAKPHIKEFGRQLYYLDLPNIIPKPVAVGSDSERSKSDQLGARWPFGRNGEVLRRAKNKFLLDLTNRNFRAIVFDYDGTLCASQERDEAPSPHILNRIEQLVENGVGVGIASGRGGSVQEFLIDALPESVCRQIHLGLYNGGWIGTAAETPQYGAEDSGFISQVTRIVRGLQSLGVPIQDFKPTHPYQLSIRFNSGLPIDSLWFVVGDALRQAGLSLGSIVKSKHSIDVLAPGVSKSKLIATMIGETRCHPYEILTMGDQGAWPGNDAALLEHKYSLSVDSPSRRLDRGWKLAPQSMRDVDATLWYLERFRISEGSFRIEVDADDR